MFIELVSFGKFFQFECLCPITNKQFTTSSLKRCLPDYRKLEFKPIQTDNGDRSKEPYIEAGDSGAEGKAEPVEVGVEGKAGPGERGEPGQGEGGEPGQLVGGEVVQGVGGEVGRGEVKQGEEEEGGETYKKTKVEPAKSTDKKV